MPDPLRLADPLALVTGAMAREVAAAHGVCGRPLIRRVLDRDTGTDTQVAIPCGSTRERVCPSCAAKARRLRIQQCAEGWHRDTEPETAPTYPTPTRATRTAKTQVDDDSAARDGIATVTLHEATFGRPGPASGAGRGPHRGSDLHLAGGSGVSAVDVPHSHPSVVRGGAGGCAGRPGHLRLPPCRARRGGVPAAGGPVLAEPASGRRVPGAVLRRRGTAAAASAASARSDPGHDPPPGDQAGGTGDVSAGVVAELRHRRSTSTASPGGTATTTSTPTPGRCCRPGRKPWTRPTPTPPRTWPGSGSSSTWLGSSPRRPMRTGRSGT